MEELLCQSCGMPMDESMFGSEADRSQSADYCHYCYRDGAFVDDVDLDGMIDVCVPHMLEAMPRLSKERAVEMLRGYLPQLKRWKREPF